jgi:DNA-binding IclR family transcriptional regulator
MVESIEERLASDADRADDEKDRQFVIALARGLQILQAFRMGDDSLSNAELARRTGLPKPTVTRLTYTLTRLGYLIPPDSSGDYRLHPHVLSLGYSVLAKLGVRQIARPLMQQLADYSRGTVALGVRDGTSMIFVERSRDRTVVTLPLEIGSRIPIATTSMGRAYLAGLPENARHLLLDEIRRSGPGEWWSAIQGGIDRELAQYKTTGYCISAGDWDPDVNAVGVPLVLRDGTVLAFNCGGPSARIPKERLSDLGERLKNVARTVAAAQGAGPEFAL